GELRYLQLGVREGIKFAGEELHRAGGLIRNLMHLAGRIRMQSGARFTFSKRLLNNFRGVGMNPHSRRGGFSRLEFSQIKPSARYRLLCNEVRDSAMLLHVGGHLLSGGYK